MKLYVPLSSLALGLCSAFILADPARAAVCHTELQSEQVALSTCRESSGLVDWTLIIQRLKGSPPLVLRATFSGDKPSFEKFWSETPQAIFETDDQRLLKDAFREVAADASAELSYPSSTAVRFLTDFVETPIAFGTYDASLIPRRSSAFRQYLMICHYRGKKRTARYSAYGRQHTLSARIGIAASGCWGRCGPGCANDGFSPANVYTQECLNHDACEHSTGERLGECQDEFWEAADGFMNAPSC